MTAFFFSASSDPLIEPVYFTERKRSSARRERRSVNFSEKIKHDIKYTLLLALYNYLKKLYEINHLRNDLRDNLMAGQLVRRDRKLDVADEPTGNKKIMEKQHNNIQKWINAYENGKSHLTNKQVNIIVSNFSMQINIYTRHKLQTCDGQKSISYMGCSGHKSYKHGFYCSEIDDCCIFFFFAGSICL